MSLLLLEELTAGRDGVPVVRELDLHVHAGEIVALLGPNGAGKTTVLETVGGVLQPLSGSVRVGGEQVRGVQRAAALGVSYVREGRGLFTQLTVRENLRLRTHSRRAAREILPRYPVLEAMADRRVGLLSGGEQQLLAIACALSVEPRFLLIDEMTMGLAPVAVKQLLTLVREAADRGVGVLFVEQHVQDALQLADRACVLRHGELVAHGTSEQLAEQLEALHDSYFDMSLPR
ncbi:ABC transporter ATP-binding protein [Streptomyces dioscori]|uniref:ABC transporter ATP-binding protein n=1 Tax=Streptomyces dioscori TaxID=2109333 RepID=A0A2P8PY84_9ACTN|nr:ATP-binding cassette domain-containing protein [Streptomyces dioscori]PSM38962.1 ABC transporter ATP-binding protein [Streptomyces dioscori]